MDRDKKEKETAREILVVDISEQVKVDVDPVLEMDRLNDTRKNLVSWTGTRGNSMCIPTDPEIKKILSEYGLEGINHVHGEPDFSCVAEVSVRISDMDEYFNHDKSSTIAQLLKTDWAKERNLCTSAEVKKYIKEHHLTIHESRDGMTEYLVPTPIHEFFKHAGGRALYRNCKTISKERVVQTVAVGIGLKVRKSEIEIEERAVDIINDNTKLHISDETLRDHELSMDVAWNALVFSGALSASVNLINVARGEIELGEAVGNVGKDATKSMGTAYGVSLIGKKLDIGKNEAALIATELVQVSKVIFSYVKGESDEEELLNGVVDTSVTLAAAYAGKLLGGAIGGTVAGPAGVVAGEIIGEIITTAACTLIIGKIENIRAEEKAFDRNIEQHRILANRATFEINEANRRMQILINNMNMQFRQTVMDGYDTVVLGIVNNSASEVSDGLAKIGKLFGLTENDLMGDRITKENLFDKNQGQIIFS